MRVQHGSLEACTARPGVLHPLALLACALCFLLASEAFGQRASHIRAYRAAGGYSAAVSVSPSGAVIARSGDTPQLTILDGFTRRDIPIPEEAHYRVHQSRSAQLWSVSQNGLLLYHQGQWTEHPLAEIRAALASQARPLRQISIVPAEVNRVLVLLPEQLLAYDATTHSARTLRLARETGLGQFAEMQEGWDESVWVTGLFGAARIPGPLRRIGPDSEWREHLLGETNRINHLQRPFEHPPGEVTASANSLGTEARQVARLDSRGWTWFDVSKDEKIRQAWQGWDRTTWGFSFNSLFRFDVFQPEILQREPVFGPQYDVALEPGGACWIAAADGLVRYAPFLWHAPPELERLQSPVYSLVFESGSGSNLWLSLPEGLVYVEGSRLELHRWPEELEATGAPRGRMFALPGGRVALSAPGRPFVFSRENNVFAPLSADEQRIHLLGQTLRGELAGWIEGAGGLQLKIFGSEGATNLALPAFHWNYGEPTFFEELPTGEIWIGGYGGLAQIRTNGTAEVYGAAHGVPEERILSLAAAGESRIWCGGESRLLELRGTRWTTILPTSERVHSIVRAEGGMWVAVQGGIYRLLEDSWIFHGANEGLASTPVFALARSGVGRLWAATGRGVATFHPLADPDEPRTLPPALVEPVQPSTAEPITIRFQAQDKWDYTASADLLFSYKLDESPWTAFSNSTVRVFQNLSSGSHVVQVLAMDRNGNKAREPAQIAFSVVVPWFKDPRLLIVSLLALCTSLVLAGLAVNKHFQLKRSYAEVGRMVAQRTAELEKANRELLHSQKMRAIGTMAAGVAHDFNNILSIIKGSAQIIENNVADKDKIRTRVNRIQTVVEQGTTIVNALLGLGRMSDSDRKLCDIGALLHETRKLLADRFSEAVKIHVDAAPDLPATECARDVLQQMLLNLILNAVDAMGGHGLVVLSAQSLAAPPKDVVLEPAEAARYLVVSVQDEGAGIDPENLPRIFEPFFTTKAFSSRRGTGLGLSMVYELAKGFGYGLAVATKPGEGSCFSIILPVEPRRGA